MFCFSLLPQNKKHRTKQERRVTLKLPAPFGFPGKETHFETRVAAFYPADFKAR